MKRCNLFDVYDSIFKPSYFNISKSPQLRPLPSLHLGCRISHIGEPLVCWRNVNNKNARINEYRTYSHPQTLLTGASNRKKHLLWTSAAISAPTPPILPASCTITSRPVLLTLSTTPSTSQGRIVLRSMSSTFALRTSLGMNFSLSSDGGGDCNSESAVSHVYKGVPYVNNVKSDPGIRVSIFDSGSSKSDMGTCSTEERYKILGSIKITGLGSRIDANSRPLAWIGDRGMTIWRESEWGLNLINSHKGESLTFSPDAPKKKPSGLCEWYKPPWPTDMHGVRIVRPPTLNCPPERYRILAASFTICPPSK